jgi:tRNA uridine 5-carboxymethylaminomethyl modification enzyme
LVAGINAARKAGSQTPLIIDRSQAYIGVMIDDLVTRGVTEPYRMFTSRAEYRLSLRADNADLRLTPLGIAAGLVGRERQARFEERRQAVEAGLALAQGLSMTSAEAARKGLKVNQDGLRRNVLDLMAMPEIGWARIVELWPELSSLKADVVEALEAEALYAGYVDRQNAEIATLRREEQLRLPAGVDYQTMAGLSAELRQKLMMVRPATLAQASRIDGMTPAALAIVLGHVKRRDRQSAA